MNTIQYYHEMNEGYTVAVKVDTTRKELLDVINWPDMSMTLMVGMAYLHPNDNYDRSVGREVSSIDLKIKMLELQNISFINDHEFITFANEEIKLVFRTSKKSSRPHLILATKY